MAGPIQTETEAPRMARDSSTTAPPPLAAFTIAYAVTPSFWTEPYSLKLNCRNGRLRLRTWGVPGIRRMGPEREPGPESPALILPAEEASAILNLLGRIRIALTPRLEIPVTDSSFYHLRLRFGDLHLSLDWYHQLPKGWDGLKPLQARLERYASTYCRTNGQETDE